MRGFLLSLFLSCYMRPEGPWRRPRRSNGGGLLQIIPFRPPSINSRPATQVFLPPEWGIPQLSPPPSPPKGRNKRKRQRKRKFCPARARAHDSSIPSHLRRGLELLFHLYLTPFQSPGPKGMSSLSKRAKDQALYVVQRRGRQKRFRLRIRSLLIAC